MTSNKASSYELSARLSGVEETDDILKPATGAELVFANNFCATLVYWGRDFGPVKERRYLISASHRFKPWPTKYLSAAIGGSILNQVTSINYRQNIQEDMKYFVIMQLIYTACDVDRT